MDGAEVARDPGSPIPEHDIDGNAVGDGESEVDVGPLVLGAARSGARDRRRNDAHVRARAIEQASAHALAGLNSEHESTVMERNTAYPSSPHGGILGESPCGRAENSGERPPESVHRK